MKFAKKLFAVLLVLTLTVALAVPAFAADENVKIIIKNAADGAVYKAYKIFDATVSGDNAAYTIPTGSGIKDASVSIEKDGNTTQVAFSDIFDVSTTGNVSQKENVSNTQVIEWLKAYAANLSNPVEVTAYASTVELSVAPGYYYITSTVGTETVVSGINTLGEEGTVIYDKRETGPSIDPGDPEDPDDGQGKKVNGKRVADMYVGETGDFTISFNATNYVVDADGTAKAITQYIVTDTPNGVTIVQDSVSVKVGTTPLAKDTDYEVEFVNGVMTVTIPWTVDKYDVPSEVVVSYKATLTDDDGEATNTAVVKYTTADGTATIDDPNDPVHTYSHSVAIDKVDADNDELYLAGAEFILSKQVDVADPENAGQTVKQTLYYVYDAENNVVSWTNDKSQATVKTTLEEDDNTTERELGTAVFVGLEAGTYTLTEIKAPSGYNLANPKDVTLTEVTTKLGETDLGTLVVSVTVEDETGATLPTTGGMGTTIFYIVGAVLVLGAVVLLVTKKRLSAER